MKGEVPLPHVPAVHPHGAAVHVTHQELLALRGIYYRLYLLQYKDQELERREPAAAG